jgi:hypothetical protein
MQIQQKGRASREKVKYTNNDYCRLQTRATTRFMAVQNLTNISESRYGRDMQQGNEK